MTDNAQLGGLRLRKVPDRSLICWFRLTPEADQVRSTRVITPAWALLKTTTHLRCIQTIPPVFGFGFGGTIPMKVTLWARAAVHQQ